MKEVKKKMLNAKLERHLMVVGEQYNEGGNPLDSFFSLFQMFCLSRVFYFGNI